MLKSNFFFIEKLQNKVWGDEAKKCQILKYSFFQAVSLEKEIVSFKQGQYVGEKTEIWPMNILTFWNSFSRCVLLWTKQFIHAISLNYYTFHSNLIVFWIKRRV